MRDGSSMRAQRRQESAKKKRQARSVYPDCPTAERLADHIASCSCPGCGNPRRHFGRRTRAELAHIADQVSC